MNKSRSCSRGVCFKHQSGASIGILIPLWIQGRWQCLWILSEDVSNLRVWDRCMRLFPKLWLLTWNRHVRIRRLPLHNTVCLWYTMFSTAHDVVRNGCSLGSGDFRQFSHGHTVNAMSRCIWCLNDEEFQLDYVTAVLPIFSQKKKVCRWSLEKSMCIPEEFDMVVRSKHLNDVGLDPYNARCSSWEYCGLGEVFSGTCTWSLRL